jgi:mRNA-degrading endonuclease RelE of RelBE toxin-antitoxin system
MNPRQRAGQRSARLLCESLSQTEGAIRRRFQNTLRDDPETREAYKKSLADNADVLRTHNDDYRGFAKGKRR